MKKRIITIALTVLFVLGAALPAHATEYISSQWIYLENTTGVESYNRLAKDVYITMQNRTPLPVDSDMYYEIRVDGETYEEGYLPSQQGWNNGDRGGEYYYVEKEFHFDENRHVQLFLYGDGYSTVGEARIEWVEVD